MKSHFEDRYGESALNKVLLTVLPASMWEEIHRNTKKMYCGKRLTCKNNRNRLSISDKSMVLEGR